MGARKPDVTAAEFAALDLRVGRVASVEAFPEARQAAWKLTVDFGPDVGVLASSAQVTNYSAEELAGRLVIGAVNLGTKRIAGFVSQCLVLGAVEGSGLVTLLAVSAPVPVGTPIG